MKHEGEVKIRLRELARITAISWSGALTEWLDFYAYTLTAAIIATLFFPAVDPIISLLGAFAALAVGFLFRPLGALFFGRLGDIYGRKLAFNVALLTMFGATIGIALLPTHAEIGILAPVGIFLFRIIQGLALGGGYGAAIVYLGESVPDKHRGFYTGFLFTTAPLGIAVIAGLIGILEGIYGAEAFKAWAWRLVFIIAAIFDLVIFVIFHLFYKETPIFSMLKTVRRYTTTPIRELFGSRHYLFLVLLVWIGVIGAHGPVWYTNQLFSKVYMDQYDISPGAAGTILSVCTLASIWVYILFGWISDKIGRRPILIAGIYLNALAFIPIFWLLREACLAKDWTMMWLLTYAMTFMNGIGYSGAQSAYVQEVFPARIRLTATAFTYNLGYGITGGLTPFAITAWYHVVFKDWFYSVIAYSTLVPIIMGLFYVLKGWETRGTRLWEELSAEKFARDGIIVKPETPIGDVCRMFIERGDRVAVVRYRGKKVGVVTERGILRAIVAERAKTAGEIAIKLQCIDEKAPVPIVLAAMDEYKIKVVPVCSNGRIRIVDQRGLLAESLGLKMLALKKVAERYTLEKIGKEPITIEDTAKLRDAISVIVRKDIGLLPVTSNGKLVAVFSEKDAIKAVAENANLDTPVIEYATKNPKTVKYSSSIKEAIELMLSLNVRHVVGVDNGYPKYIASVKDVLAIA